MLYCAAFGAMHWKVCDSGLNRFSVKDELVLFCISRLQFIKMRKMHCTFVSSLKRSNPVTSNISFTLHSFDTQVATLYCSQTFATPPNPDCTACTLVLGDICYYDLKKELKMHWGQGGEQQYFAISLLMYIWGFRAHQHLRSLAPVMNDEWWR